jgi:hypothetical protein
MRFVHPLIANFRVLNKKQEKQKNQQKQKQQNNKRNK